MSVTVVTNAAELQAIENDLAGDHRLGNDIDLSVTAGWNEDNGTFLGFDPLDELTGDLDGDGHVVTDIHIEREGERDVALIGRASGCIIEDIGMVGGFIKGGDAADVASVGALVGFTESSSATIRRVFARGMTIEANNDSNNTRLGGLIGRHLRGTLTDFYAANTVTAPGTNSTRRAGAIGQNHVAGTTRGYAAGTADGPVQGFSGQENTATTDCFWDETLNSNSSAGGTGKTTAEMQDIDTYTDTETVGLDSAWDMVLKANHDGELATAVWWIDHGEDYPRLWFEFEDEEPEPPAVNIAAIAHHRRQMMQ